LEVIVPLRVLPKEFRAAWEIGKAGGIPLHEAGQSTTGFSHCDSGRLLAERWQLLATRPLGLIEVIGHHRVPEKSVEHAGFVALLSLADLLCRMGGPNYGYVEQRQTWPRSPALPFWPSISRPSEI